MGCIVVKDLSRLGRNYVEVGNLLAQSFPLLGVRVISVNDGYDSGAFTGQTGGIDMAFENLVYNLYSRDLSYKVKSAVETRMKRGECRDSFMYCPTGRNHKDSICRDVRIRRDVAEDMLVRLVRQQAEMLVRAEDVLKERKNRNGGKPATDMGVLLRLRSTCIWKLLIRR